MDVVIVAALTQVAFALDLAPGVAVSGSGLALRDALRSHSHWDPLLWGPDS